MKRWILIGMVVASGMTIQAQNKLPEKFPYQDTSLTAEERADDLLKRLTLEEKASLMMNGSPAIPRLSIKDRKSTRLNSSHPTTSRMPSSA